MPPTLPRPGSASGTETRSGRHAAASGALATRSGGAPTAAGPPATTPARRRRRPPAGRAFGVEVIDDRAGEDGSGGVPEGPGHFNRPAGVGHDPDPDSQIGADRVAR